MNKRALGCLIELAETVLLTLLVFFLVQTFVAQPYQVQQESMLPTFQPSDYVLVDKLTPRFDSYSRGDVIVFESVERSDCAGDVTGNMGGEPFIKRVIGEPGDTVELRDGTVLVNGIALDEPYVHGAPSDQESDLTRWIVPTDRLFVMGDNRRNSVDSRSFGPVCVRDVVGRAWLRYWPLSRFGIVDTPRYSAVPAPSKGPSPSPSSSAAPTQ